MLSLSYVMPVTVVTGSSMIWNEMGQTKYWGISTSAIVQKEITNEIMCFEMIVLLENIGRIGKRVASFGKGLLLNKY